VVVEALARRIKNKFKIGFYHNRKEIDVCFENFGIEVKWQKGVSTKDFPKVDVENKLLISKDKLEFDENKNLLIIPSSLFLALI